MGTLIQLKELPFKEFSYFERFKNFDSTLELDKLVMVILIGFTLIFIGGIALYIIGLNIHNVKLIGRVIVIGSILSFINVLNISEKYLPTNNYDTYISDYQVKDKIYENIDNPHDKYLYRDGYYKINGYKTDVVSEDIEEIVVYKN